MAEAMGDEARSAPAAGDAREPVSAAAAVEASMRAVADLGAALAAMLALAQAELRLSGASAGAILLVAIVAGGCALSAWVLVQIAIVQVLMALELPLAAALLATALLDLLGVWLGARSIRRHARALGFSRSARALRELLGGGPRAGAPGRGG